VGKKGQNPVTSWCKAGLEGVGIGGKNEKLHRLKRKKNRKRNKEGKPFHSIAWCNGVAWFRKTRRGQDSQRGSNRTKRNKKQIVRKNDPVALHQGL